METIQEVAKQVGIAMENIRLERLNGNRLSTLREAARILEEMGEIELADKVLNKIK